jgi:hypothetical protein
VAFINVFLGKSQDTHEYRDAHSEVHLKEASGDNSSISNVLKQLHRLPMLGRSFVYSPLTFEERSAVIENSVNGQWFQI